MRTTVARAGLAAASALAFSCGAPPTAEIRFRIEPVLGCEGRDVGEIGCVRVRLVGARMGVECLEGEKRVRLPGHPTRIEDVQGQLEKESLLFDVPAARGYQMEVIGYRMDDCFLGSTPDPAAHIRFCGRSDPVRFDAAAAQTIRVPTQCGSAALTCAGFNASLRFCQ